jgi:acyl-coenzyme A synthetase/AMP-(fatty) acid ligase
MLWQLVGIVLTSVLIAIVFRLDRAHGVEREEEAFIAATSGSTGEPR